MILYHGSNTTINDIDLNKCHLYKDFGQAFYLTDDKNQAMNVANARVDIFGGKPVVSSYHFDERLFADGTLSLKSFENYSNKGSYRIQIATRRT